MDAELRLKVQAIAGRDDGSDASVLAKTLLALSQRLTELRADVDDMAIVVEVVDTEE